MATVDDIVVGCGLAGAAVASRLATHGRKVLIIEHGRPIGSSEGGHVRNSAEHQANRDAYFARIDRFMEYLDPAAPPAGLPGAFDTSIFGGMSVLWTNNFPRAVAGVDRPTEVPEKDWEAYYGVAEDLLGVDPGPFGDSIRQGAVAGALESDLRDEERAIIPMPLAGNRVGATGIHYVGPADVLAPIANSIEVRRGSLDRLHLDGGRISAVIDGKPAASDTVTLACGAIETPRILWQAGRRPPALGRFLSYHVILFAQIVLAEGLWDDGPGVDPLPRLYVPPTPRSPWQVMVLRDTNPLTPDPIDAVVPEDRLIGVQAFLPVNSSPDSRMDLAVNGPITFDAPLRTGDMTRRDAILDDVDRIASRIGRYRRGCEPRWLPAGSAHLVGSTRMGTVDATSVTDPFGRVRGTDDLYVASNGVIPTRMAVNPTPTMLALAARTSDRIVA